MAKMDEATRKRVRAGRLMLAGKTPAQAASAVGVARQTAYTWKARLEEGGIEALRSMATGRPAQLDAKQLGALRSALLQGAIAHGFGTELWTLKRVRALIERLYGVRFSEVHVWRLLGAMGFSSQKPERRAMERNEEAVLAWKRKTWPALKKSVRPSSGCSSSSTNRGCRSDLPGSERGPPGAARRSCSCTSTGSTFRPSPG
jgi:transposase